jgi:hypothetical protein
MQRWDGHTNPGRQFGMKFFKRRVRVFGNQLSHFFFIRLKFWSLAALVFFWRDASGLATLLAKRINPRDADGVFSRRILTRHAAVAILQNTFPQIQRISPRHETLREKKRMKTKTTQFIISTQITQGQFLIRS